ncbi:MAG: CotH kinase family protein [Phycisphaeraceae bacterium]|nr:MAG: CotH kinase family protein [Phycisphaeraceae bacterium]
MRCTALAAFFTAVPTLAAIAETPPPTGDAGYTDAGDTIFVDDELTLVTVTLDPADLQAMLADPWNDTYRLCTVRIANSRIDDTITDVGIHPRGNTARNAIKKSWKLKFNEFVPGRTVHGLEKLNINGHQNDPSVVRGKLAWDTYNGFGVPSPRASMVHLVINDGSLVDDVYANVEQIDDEFLKAWFGNDTGNLYQCGYKGRRADLRYIAPGDAAAYQNIGGTYELEEDSGANQFVDLADFISFIEFADDATFAAELVDRFAVDNFLRSLAVDCVNGHWDNMWYGANNFFLYANPDTGRFEYVPYDLDNTYGIDFFSTNWATRPPLSFGNGGFGWDYGSAYGGGPEPPLVRRVLAIDAYRDQYLRYVRELVGALGEPNEPVPTVYTDTAGDVFNAGTDPHFDLLGVTLANDWYELFAEVTVAGPIDVGGTTDQSRIVFFFNTRPGGSTSNPWGRAINTPVRADYFLGTWTDHGGGFLFYEWNGTSWDLLHASFNDPGGLGQDLSDKVDGVVRYTIPLEAMNLLGSDAFTFDVVTTNDRGGGFEPGLDHLSNPSMATPDYNTASTAGDYLNFVVTPIEPDPGAFVDGPFTLPPREALIDSLRDQLAPYAFQASFDNGHSDYGYTDADFLASFDSPAAWVGAAPWAWGIKPYIEARTDDLRANAPVPDPLPPLFINEVISNNDTIIADEAGQFEDFIEIYNAGDVPVDLSGMWLTDDPGFPRAWPIPAGTIIAAGGYLLIWADNDPADGPLHATFGLSTGGETVALFHNDANGVVLIDSLTFPALAPDESFGRFPDGDEYTEVFCAVTPLGANDDDDSCFIDPDPTPRVFVNEWLASNDGVIVDEFGDADDMFELYNDEGAEVDLGGRYLTDDLANPTKWAIPAGVVIPAKGYLVFWADDETTQGPMHAAFKLSAGGESVGLFDRADNAFAPIDAVSFGSQTTDVSEGRTPDGAACIATLPAPSPGAANPAGPADLNADGLLDLADISGFIAAFVAGEPAADLDGNGLYDLADINTFIARFGDPCP